MSRLGKYTKRSIGYAVLSLSLTLITACAQLPEYAKPRRIQIEVYSEIVQQIKDMINSAMEANQKRHEEFDKDTSLFISPAWQAWWLETVQEELKQTESALRGW